MSGADRTWVVLVAGTHADPGAGAATPLQEIRLLLARAKSVGGGDRTCAIIAAEVRREWRELATFLTSANTIVHPAGDPIVSSVARSLRSIDERDPAANVILIPADHCAVDEALWLDAAQGALRLGIANADTVYILHDRPENDPRVSKNYPGLCSTSVMVGSATSILALCAGNRTQAIVDLVVEDTAPQRPPGDPAPAAAKAPAAAEAPVNVVHVRSVEEYARLQRGDYGHRSSRVNLHA